MGQLARKGKREEQETQTYTRKPKMTSTTVKNEKDKSCATRPTTITLVPKLDMLSLPLAMSPPPDIWT